MKVSKEKSAENRARILEAAARLFRERGLQGTGVDALVGAAGLSHGSLYSQFGSKDRLAAEALAAALDSGTQSLLPPGEAPELGMLVRRYLSRRHRDAPGGGCALAALGSEMPRQGPALRSAYTAGLRRLAGRIAALLQEDRPDAREDAALATLAMLVGTLTLARAVDDPALSDRLLALGRRHLGAARD
ncbi:TetR/AcrR family transcriptional regulator [Paracraurococcus lichenis]|uniref:Helix-turn-helix domain-containing protein n=1 Tax=Paracraurococcus lichenis TaxID=3064888 RepID=A0ABT9E615_9PROT|nr:TetR/AcrR family transcriptional regulator [Paracraurococcus sp. LOR1-02]MDO9711625.1 helix-turn-helix domain-containing protein [Paracraurococcus sp. LOR1-02]